MCLKHKHTRTHTHAHTHTHTHTHTHLFAWWGLQHYLDQDQVCAMAMVGRYAMTRVLLNELLQAGILSCQV